MQHGCHRAYVAVRQAQSYLGEEPAWPVTARIAVAPIGRATRAYFREARRAATRMLLVPVLAGFVGARDRIDRRPDFTQRRRRRGEEARAPARRRAGAGPLSLRRVSGRARGPSPVRLAFGREPGPLSCGRRSVAGIMPLMLRRSRRSGTAVFALLLVRFTGRREHDASRLVADRGTAVLKTITKGARQ